MPSGMNDLNDLIDSYRRQVRDIDEAIRGRGGEALAWLDGKRSAYHKIVADLEDLVDRHRI